MNHSEIIEAHHYPDLVADTELAIHEMDGDLLHAVDLLDPGLLDRVEALLDFTLTVVGSANPLLLTTSRTTELRARLQDFAVSVRRVSEFTPDLLPESVVAEVTMRAEALANELLLWPRTESEDWRQAVTNAATTYRRSLGQQIVPLQADIDALKQARIDLGAELDRESTQRREALDREFADLSQRLATLDAASRQVQNQQASFEMQLDRALARADEVLSTMQEQFSQSQEERTRSAAAAREKMVEDTGNLLAAQESNADSLLSAIQEHVDSAANLVSVFAAAGTANAYSKEAIEQNKAANIWRWGAVALGVLAGLAAVTVLIGTASGDAAWQLVIGKLAIGIVFGGLASYAARQSARHRRREESARHLELNLATFGPLAEDLDEEALATARAQLVSEMLRREEARGSTNPDLESIGPGQVDVLQRLLDILKQRG